LCAELGKSIAEVAELVRLKELPRPIEVDSRDGAPLWDRRELNHHDRVMRRRREVQAWIDRHGRKPGAPGTLPLT
jgi:hypothetical protein